MGKGKAGIEGLSVSKARFERGSGGLSLAYTKLSMMAFLAASLRSLTESA